MDNVCRTCLKISKIFLNIFDHFRNNTLISDAIIQCTNIKVHKNDGLPLNICSNCLEKLNAAYDFKVLATETDIKLRSHYSDIVKGSSQQHNETVSCDFSFVKAESPIVKVVEADLLQKNTCDESQLLEHIKTEYISSNSYEADREKTVETNDLLIDDENMKVIDNRYQDKNSIKIEENIGHEYNSNLDNRSILTNSPNSEYEGYSSVEVGLIPSENGNKSTSVYEDQELDLLVSNKNLSLTDKEEIRKSVFCKECNKCFGYHYYVDKHMHFHTGKKLFKCDICGKAFAKQFQLKKHKAIHQDDRPYLCKICGERFNNLTSLQIHEIEHSKGRKFKCDWCGKTFKSESTLKGHLSRHRNNKRFICGICGKEFVNSYDLGVHKKDHSSACSICGKMFSSNSTMNRHLNLHSDLKRHVCSHCGRRFKNKKNLQNHTLIHTGEKPFKCYVCSKDFRQSSSLTLHMRTHR